MDINVFGIKNNLTVGKINIEDFNSMCDKLEIGENSRARNNILKITGESKKFNRITNYFSKKK